MALEIPIFHLTFPNLLSQYCFGIFVYVPTP